MLRPLLFVIALVQWLALSASAATLVGTFLASIDDHATVFVNGSKVFHGDLGTSRSGQTTLNVGDRVIVHMSNDQGPKHLLLVFATTDGKQIVSFRASDFHIVPELGVNTFDGGQFPKWTKQARKLQGTKGLDREVKNYSERVWGDLDKCTLACVITAQMVTPRPR
ncbi:MAG: hypothetical protein JWO08_1117 [Verrucomicrobiaceae bacterium]|nr:hypothetical protein [Verrucomicrobiaceae bacterium]